jgi:archaemetzincin
MEPSPRSTNWVMLLCVAGICFGLLSLRGWRPWRYSFVPPDEDERELAVGGLEDASLELARAFHAADPSFRPIPVPGPSDWLKNHSESGQTFAQYQMSEPNRPDELRHTIYIQPLGEFTEDVAPELRLVKDFAHAFFGMPIRELPVEAIENLPVQSRPREQGQQILTTDVLKWLKRRVPADAYCLLALTMTDLYPEPSWNFVFGQASLSDRVGVYSFARLGQQPDPEAPSLEQLLLLRSCKILSHEAGHMFGIRHCIHFHCLMNGVNNLSEMDAAPIHLCPVCLRKLHDARPFHVVDRYRNLQSVCQKLGWDRESQWLDNRIQTISSRER